MTILWAICISVTVAYASLMVLYLAGWHKQRNFAVPDGFRPSVSISVIIPARNEQDNIGACIASLLQQNYPRHLYQIIVVDDHSTDNTAVITRSYADKGVTIVSLSEVMPENAGGNAYKKMAITAGIAASEGTLIVTTDADCIVPENWLQHIAAIYEQRKPAMIVAPVVYKITTGIADIFQHTDFMSMQGITAAAHAMGMGGMSNGANLAFTRAAFEQVNGYEGNMHLASGDDYLLMTKISKLPGAPIAYLKAEGAIVTTKPQPDWPSFFRQRVRWASKSGKYDDSRLTAILILVYLFNVMIVALAIGSVIESNLLSLLCIILAIKTLSELIYLIPVAKFFKSSGVLLLFPFLQPLHVAYIVSAGFMGFRGGYEWKGRAVR